MQSICRWYCIDYCYIHLCNALIFGSCRIGFIVYTSAILFNEFQIIRMFRYIRNPNSNKAGKIEEKVNIIKEAVRKARIETLGGLLGPIKYFQYRRPHRGWEKQVFYYIVNNPFQQNFSSC